MVFKGRGLTKKHFNKKSEKHHTEIAIEKYLKGEDITVCLIENGGVTYKGYFYSDCYLEGSNGRGTACIEVDGYLHVFTPGGRFACAFLIGADVFEIYDKKPYMGW